MEKLTLIGLLLLLLKQFVEHDSTNEFLGAISDRFKYWVKGKNEQALQRDQSNVISNLIEALTLRLDSLYTTVSLYHNGNKVGIYQKWSMLFEVNNFWSKSMPSIIRDYQGVMLYTYYDMIEEMKNDGFVIYSKDSNKNSTHAKKTLAEIETLGATCIMYAPIKRNGSIIACLSVVSDDFKKLKENQYNILSIADKIGTCIEKAPLIIKI